MKLYYCAIIDGDMYVDTHNRHSLISSLPCNRVKRGYCGIFDFYYILIGFNDAQNIPQLQIERIDIKMI
jgi:hypothetical protein